MIDESDLFVALAEIAGVFVGFGALIGFGRRGEISPVELARVRLVVVIGLVVIVAALIPVGLDRYGLGEPALWRLSSGTFFALIWASILLPFQRAETRGSLLAQARANPGATAFFWLFLEVPIQLPLVLAVLGYYPSLAPAFYTTALVLNVFEAAFTLVQLVFSEGA